MTHEQLLAVLKGAGAPVCDDCLYAPAGYSARQGVRAAGIVLAERGQIVRGRGVCVACGRQKIVNFVPNSTDSGSREAASVVRIASGVPRGWESGAEDGPAGSEVSGRGQSPESGETVYLTTREFGARFGVAPDQVAAWCREGRLRAISSDSGRWLISESEIDRLCEAEIAYRRSFEYKVTRALFGTQLVFMTCFLVAVLLVLVGIVVLGVWLVFVVS